MPTPKPIFYRFLHKNVQLPLQLHNIGHVFCTVNFPVCGLWHKLESLCYIFYCLHRGLHGLRGKRGEELVK
ncbi:hypothetical protein C6501_01540 [Candidatus Poribacteria bacterium]|nr:MAG: hypothetical protein C6501_01540 [Candidatus Poribacteria bacterium]